MESMSEKMGSLQNRFDLGEEEKVTGDQIGRIWRVFQNCNVPFEKLTNTQGCVIKSVIVMECPCVSFPKRSTSCQALSHKALKNVFIDGLVHCLALG